jgi:hypothetical protein
MAHDTFEKHEPSLHDVVRAACEDGLRGMRLPRTVSERTVVATLAHAIGLAVARDFAARNVARPALPVPQLLAIDLHAALRRAGCRAPFSVANHVVADLNAVLASNANAASAAMPALTPLVRPQPPNRVEQMSAADWRL